MGSGATRGGLTPRSGFRPERLVVDGGDQDSIEGPVDLGHRSERQGLAVAAFLGGETRQPASEHRGGQLRQGDVAEVREDVVAEIGVVDPLGGGPEVDDRALPFGRPAAERHPAVAGIDPFPLVEVGLLAALVALRFLPGAEGAGAFPAVGAPEPHLVSDVSGLGLTLFDHRNLPSERMASALTETTDIVVDGVNRDSGSPTDVDHFEVALLDELVDGAAPYAESPSGAFDGEQQDGLAGGVRSYFGGDAGDFG